MKHQMFAIYDSKANAYLPPWVIHQNEMAIRLFADMCNDPKHQFGKNPADYTLFNIGAYDDNKGQVENQKLNISLGNGIEFVKETAQQQLFTDPEIGDLKVVD